MTYICIIIVNYLVFHFFLHSAISNQNVNINTNTFKRDGHHHIVRNRDKHHKQNTTENISITEHGTLEEASTNCTSSNKKNQRYSSSFVGNTTERALTVENEFHKVVGNNSKVKKTSSVHEGEDITLCWIETTTIKEDKTTRPPKRLVIREYTISFENSATIPERYLECKRFEGELMANDPDIGKTALFEIVDEDTMVSRIVNFTSISHVGNILIWEHKKVKCGVGPVVSKNIIEINDSSENPKKRVEIKVSPKMHQLTAMTTEEECTESSEEIEESSTLIESTEHTTELPCENAKNGACEVTTTSASISTKREVTTEEIIIELQRESESQEVLNLSTSKSITSLDEEVSRRTTIFPRKSSTIQEYQKKTDCKENSSDPSCLTKKDGTSSSEKLFPSVTTEAVMTAETLSTPIGEKEIITKEGISIPSIEERLEEITTESSFTSGEEEEIISDLIVKETTPFVIATDISMESSETYPQSTDQVAVDTTTLKTEIITSPSMMEHIEEHSKPEEGSGDSSIELTSEELDKIDQVSSSEVDVGQYVTTTKSPIKFTEFTEESAKPDKILDKLSERPISTESVITESSSTFKEVAGESEESVTSVIEGTTMLKSTEEREIISVATTTPTDVKATLSPAISSELSYSCEDSEDCAYVTSSESCDESGNCDEITTKSCESEVCSEEEVIDDQSRVDTTLSPIMTKVPSATDLQSEELTTIETQHTTVANVATTMLTSRESENNLSNIPIIIDSRRSTTTSTPQHKLTLKVKVLLEHINENKEKHNLVELEKHLPLDENPEHHDNPDLIEQLKSLNESVNMETINALLNCTTLGNLTRNPNFVSKEPGDAIDNSNQDLKFTNSDLDDLILEQFTSGYVDGKNDYSDYQEHEVPPQRRRRRSLDDEMENLNRLVKRNLYDPNDSVVDSLNISKAQHDLIKDNLQLSTTTNNPEEETSNTTYTESERNVTMEGNESTMPSTKMSLIDDVDLSNATESPDVNLTKENIQFTTTIFTTTNKPEEVTTNAIYIENEQNVTNERNESAVPSIKENISNETKMEVVRETLPGIQEDVVVGLQHIASQLAQSNLTAANIKETVKTNLLDIITDPLDNRVRSRRRRTATEEVGHWSNERIKEAPMGGNLRSFTEFTLYKVLP